MANGENVTPTRLKNNNNGVKIVKYSLNIEKISPRKIGNLADTSESTLEKELLKYEKIIALTKIENALIFK